MDRLKGKDMTKTERTTELMAMHKQELIDAVLAQEGYVNGSEAVPGSEAEHEAQFAEIQAATKPVKKKK